MIGSREKSLAAVVVCFLVDERTAGFLGLDLSAVQPPIVSDGSTIRIALLFPLFGNIGYLCSGLCSPI